MTMRESLAQEAARITADNRCSCGKKKFPGKPFCIECYFKLPARFKNSLKSGDSLEFATAFDEAREWLRDN